MQVHNKYQKVASGKFHSAKKQVYINQFVSASSRNLLPLSAGLLYAYACTLPEISNNFNLNIEIVRDLPEKVVAKYKDPVVLAFSTYFWNFSQSIQVAKLAKKRFPNVVIVFGGPMVPLIEIETKEFFQRYPFVDIIAAGEGEVVFSDMLLALINGQDVKTVEGVCYHDKKNKRVFYKQRRPYLKDLSKLPSPYLDGTFDELYDRHKHTLFTGAIFETNRGCPFSCTYCFWGGPDSRVVTFPLDKVYAELDWMSRHKIDYISGADANFGILKRDLEIAKYIARRNRETGYPKYLAINWSKNTNKKIFDIADVLSKSRVKFMLTTSAQSYNPDTLKAIKRDNIHYEEFSKLVRISNENDYHIHYSEFILGLPLETYQSFIEGIRKSLVDYQNHWFNIYYCYLIPSTEMAKREYRERYKIETRRCVVSFERTIDVENAVPEYEDIVVSTSTMPIEDWKRSFIFGYFIKALYCYRIAYFMFNYLRKQYNVDLIKLTEFIINECSNNQSYKTITGALKVLNDLEDSILNNDRETIKINGAKTSLHPEVAVFIIFLSEKERFYHELYHCLNKYLDLNRLEVDEEIWKEILAYQFSIIPIWKHTNKHYLRFNYNLYDHFAFSKNIIKSPNRIIFGDEITSEDADEFMRKRIYGGLKFSISDVRRYNKADSSHKFIDAKSFFETFIM